MTQTQAPNQPAKPEVLGEWTTEHGNRLTLMARRTTGYASIWLTHLGKPAKIGSAAHSGRVLREVRWDEPWREQTEAWKNQQRRHIASLIATWHAEGIQPPRPAALPSTVIGTFDCFGFRFAVEPTAASEHAVLSVINVAGARTPVADLLHDQGRICGMRTRPGWKSTPDDRKRTWRHEAETILTQAAQQGRL
jgi:hypothetical protein